MFFRRASSKLPQRKVSEIFVAGGAPTVTYVARGEKHLEKQVTEYLTNRHSILSITGPTKSGKTVLWNHVLPKGGYLHLEGGILRTFRTTDQIFATIAHQAGIPINTVETRETALGAGLAAGAAGINGKKTTSSTARFSPPPIIVALEYLKSSDAILVFDDFHHIPAQFQADIILALKQSVFAGLRVILVSVDHRGFDPEKVEREMNLRVSHLTIPPWDNGELQEIADKGFSALNVTMEPRLTWELAANCFGSPALMQSVCRQVCLDNNIAQTSDTSTGLALDDFDKVFRNVAKNQIAPIDLDRLLSFSRGDKSKRTFYAATDGHKYDLYDLVVRAIRPQLPMTSVRSIDLHTEAKKMLAEPNQELYVAQITSSLKRMSDAAKSMGGEPPIEWDQDQQKIHIVDPLLAFRLKWGDLDSTH